jgi:hypothetical protein
MLKRTFSRLIEVSFISEVALCNVVFVDMQSVSCLLTCTGLGVLLNSSLGLNNVLAGYHLARYSIPKPP